MGGETDRLPAPRGARRPAVARRSYPFADAFAERVRTREGLNAVGVLYRRR